MGPRLELLHGGGAEGVGGGDSDGVTVNTEQVAELSGRSRFAGAIDADNEDDGGLAVFAKGGGKA